MVTNDDHSSSHDGPTGIPGTDELMSAWPPFVALGFVISEIGIVMNLVPLAFGGLLLFGGSVAGIIRDASLTKTPWGSLGIMGALFTVLGGIILNTQLQSYTIDHAISVSTSNAIGVRGGAVLLAGIVLVLAAIVGSSQKPLQNEA